MGLCLCKLYESHLCSSLSSVTIEVIQVDDSGEPLSIGETLDNLEKVAGAITRSDVFPGAEVGSVSAVIPSETTNIVFDPVQVHAHHYTNL